MPNRWQKIAGRHVRIKTDELDGYYQPHRGDEPDEIWLNPQNTDDRIAYTIIHEVLHAECPWLDEDVVKEISQQQAKLLLKMGTWTRDPGEFPKVKGQE